MLTKSQCTKLIMTALTLLSLSTNLANAAEKRALQQVSLDELIKETQQQQSNFSTNSNSVDLVWWIPPEYWEVALSQDPSTSPANRELMLKNLQSVFIVGVVQADISPVGAFEFFANTTIQKGMRVTYTESTGKTLALKPVDKISEDLSLLLEIVRPIFANTMGNLGQNLAFFVYDTFDTSGKRLVSPYESGEFKVLLSDRNGIQRSKHLIELPLNSLFVSRVCPNGKPAHISWKYCPWDGSRLTN